MDRDASYTGERGRPGGFFPNFEGKKRPPAEQLLQLDEGTQRLFLDPNQKIDNVSAGNAELIRKVLLLTVPQANHTCRVFVPFTSRVHMASNLHTRPDSLLLIAEVSGTMTTFGARNTSDKISVRADLERHRFLSRHQLDPFWRYSLYSRVCHIVLWCPFSASWFNGKWPAYFLSYKPPFDCLKCSLFIYLS